MLCLLLLTAVLSALPFSFAQDMSAKYNQYGQLLSPLTVKSAKWLGNVTSDNANEARDLGYQGEIAGFYINTFGDTAPCKDSNPQTGCMFQFIGARNSAGYSQDAITFADVQVDAISHVVSKEFVKYNPIWGESNITPMGVTNVVPTTGLSGIVYYLPGTGKNYAHNGGSLPYFKGAGIATIQVAFMSGFTVTRATSHTWNGKDGSGNPTELYVGSMGAIVGQDGYIYAFSGIPDDATGGIGLARVPQAQGANMNAYEYWNGKSFQKQRLYNPTSSVAVLTANQGSVWFSKYYKKYIYISAMVYDIFCMTADRPEGPWSPAVHLWSLRDSPVQYSGGTGGFYAPVIQAKESDPEGKYMVFWHSYGYDGAKDGSGGHMLLQSVRIDFA